MDRPSLLLRGQTIHQRINDLAEALKGKELEKAMLSYDVYFDLIEYTTVVNEGGVDRNILLWELVQRDALYFDTGVSQLKIEVDWFAEKNSIVVV
jgi:hypothetical protein